MTTQPRSARPRPSPELERIRQRRQQRIGCANLVTILMLLLTLLVLGWVAYQINHPITLILPHF